MRSEGLSLRAAARAALTTAGTVRKYVGRTLRRTAGGRYAATASDRLVRHLFFLTENGPTEIRVQGSRAASRIASYMAAVEQYLSRGDASGLAPFQDQEIRSGKNVYHFVTDLEALERLAHAGEVSFERLYVQRS